MNENSQQLIFFPIQYDIEKKSVIEWVNINTIVRLVDSDNVLTIRYLDGKAARFSEPQRSQILYFLESYMTHKIN